MDFWTDVHYITESFNKIIHLINPLWFVAVWIIIHVWFDVIYRKFTTVDYINGLAGLSGFNEIERSFWRNELVFKAPKFVVDLLSNLIFLFYTPVSYELKTYVFLIIVIGFFLKSIPIVFGRTNLILYFRDFFDLLTITLLFVLGIASFDSFLVKGALVLTLVLLIFRTKAIFFAPIKLPNTNNFYNRRYFTVELLSIRESHAYLDIFFKLMTAMMLMTINDFSFIIPLIGCHLFFVYLRKLSFTDGYSALTSSKISYFDTNGIPFEYIGIFLGAILATVAFFSRDVLVIVPISVLFVVLMVFLRKHRAQKFEDTHNFYLIVDPSARVNFNKLALRLYRRVVYLNPNKKETIFSKLESMFNGISNDLIVLNAFSFHYRIYKSTFSITDITKENVRNILFIHDNKKEVTLQDEEVLSITEYQLNQALQNVYCCIDFFDFDILLSDDKSAVKLNSSLNRIRLQMEAAYEKISSTDDVMISSNSERNWDMPLEEKINIDLSLEGSKHNHYLLKFVFQQPEIDATKNISLHGIHELATIFRQMHEDPSPSTRFIEIINLCEILSCYCMAIIYAKNETTGADFWLSNETIGHSVDRSMPLQVSFGAVMSRIRLWEDEFDPSKNDSLLAEKLFAFLNFPLNDFCKFDQLSSFAFEDLKIGDKKGLKGRVTVQLFLDFITGVRNKTRGHGAMTKVDFEVYVELEVIVLHLLNQFSLLPGNLINLVETDDADHVALSYKTGGLISFIPVDWSKHEKYVNPYLKDAEQSELKNVSNTINQFVNSLHTNKMYWYVSNEGSTEIWNLDRFIQVDHGKAYLFSEQKKNGTKHFISYSTGKHSNLKDAGIDLEN